MLMMCQRIGRPPTSTLGLGLSVVSSDRRVPRPPARITVFMGLSMSRKGSFRVSVVRYLPQHVQSAARRVLPAVGPGADQAASPQVLAEGFVAQGGADL